MPDHGPARPPKLIWMLWLQGWDQAPAIAHAARRSWAGRNPAWELRALDRTSLAQVLPAETLNRLFDTPKPMEALSDQIRLELLYRHGGVWADATTICARPLDDWLAQALPRGFFAFSRPAPDRMLSTWFLAAEKGSEIIDRWRAGGWEYWQDRQERGDYFWLHMLFAEIYERNARVRALWDATPVIPAQHRFHFGPEAETLKRPPGPEIAADLANPPVPVFKLTHKFATPPGAGSLFERLCAFAGAAGGGEQGQAGDRV
jgi:Capsular polysaccharide synthesis protein